MNFDGALDISGSLCSWSPNGRYLAVVVSRSRLVLRESNSLEVLFSEICSSVSSGARTSLLTGEDSKIDKLGFSPDSAFVYASSFKAGVTHVFQVQWRSKYWTRLVLEWLGSLDGASLEGLLKAK